MPDYFLRNFTVLLNAFYAFYKLLNLSPKAKNLQIHIVTVSVTVSVLAAVIFKTNQSGNWIFILLLFFLISKLYMKIDTTIIYLTVLFSFSLSFIAFTMSSIILSLVLLPFFVNNYNIPWLLVRITGNIIHFSLIYYCFRIPRLKKGMGFIYHIPSSNTGSTLCNVMIMLIIMFSQSKTKPESFMLIFHSIILFSSYLFTYWWNYHITQTYRKLLKKNEIDSLNLLLEERNQEIAYLKNENEKLSRIIHKDNKLLPAISMAILDFPEKSANLDLPKTDNSSSLHIKLKELYAEREQAVVTYEKERIPHLPETLYPSVNAVLSYMQTEALKHNIPYQVLLFDDLSDTIPKEVSEDDFVHLLSDLLANAINACRNTNSGMVQIYLGKTNGISTIKICNSESVFNIETLKVLGQTKHTTHADTGGSGIGLMDIWMLKEKYKATLLIDELTNSTSSSILTCVNILFNHKGHYIVQSDRYKELSISINRPDMMILPKE